MVRRVVVLATALASCAGIACSGEPRTDAERLARGREIVEKMSAKLGGAKEFSVTTVEARQEVKPDGSSAPVNLTRHTTLRRGPDRLYSTVDGDRHNEVWYDGIGLTVVVHNDKIFGQARMPETLDKTLDSIHERYGVPVPVADYIYTNPAKALLADTTTGGWAGRETVDGVAADHVAFKDKGVNWDIWIPSQGDPVPLKASAQFEENPRLKKIDLAFKEWNFAPTIAEDRFKPTVPSDYEGVALIQRARILRNVPEEADGTTGEVKK